MNTNILIIGNDANVTTAIEKEITQYDSLIAYSATDTEKAIEVFHQYPIDIVLFSPDLEKEDEKKMRILFMHQNKNLIITNLQKDNCAQLKNILATAIDQLNRNYIRIMDGAL